VPPLDHPPRESNGEHMPHVPSRATTASSSSSAAVTSAYPSRPQRQGEGHHGKPALLARIFLQDLAHRRASNHISPMANETDLHLKITPGPPFWWEIYRGSDPQWVERSMFGYLMENEARHDGEAAVRRLINREMQAKRTMERTNNDREADRVHRS
jgi:hypothetical protein